MSAAGEPDCQADEHEPAAYELTVRDADRTATVASNSGYEPDREQGLPVVVVAEIVGRAPERDWAEQLESIQAFEVIPPRDLGSGECGSWALEQPWPDGQLRDQVDGGQSERQGRRATRRPSSQRSGRAAATLLARSSVHRPNSRPKGQDEQQPLLGMARQERHGHGRAGEASPRARPRRAWPNAQNAHGYQDAAQTCG